MIDGQPYQHPSRLFIGAYGRRVELAEFLADSEKRGLAAHLRDLLKGADGTASERGRRATP
jgi:hypothetical protein